MPRPRLVRAAVAGVVGLALLSGGGGSYAEWFDTATMGGATVTSGQLLLEQQAMSVTLTRTANGATTSQDVTGGLAAQRLIGGDTLTFTVPVKLLVQGDTLTATLTLDTSAIAGHDSSAALRDAMVRGMTVRINQALTPVPGTPRSWTVTPAQHNTVVTATITTTVPTSGGTQGQTLTPGAITWSLTQNGAAA
ncbi:alternate-type signal peptide domain-containing protein [Georgenia sp. SYP-B2076]|uniref:alternate-type signal peptide domain-containing protein n=1 Tax=Georgenia sp. SYP-B2076 TaxID=2495881 RepID=UPI0013E0619E|nr:alternate-type signal peptide domain-containing protein [Georgenia sp. SYP-B2076]